MRLREWKSLRALGVAAALHALAVATVIVRTRVYNPDLGPLEVVSPADRPPVIDPSNAGDAQDLRDPNMSRARDSRAARDSQPRFQPASGLETRARPK